MSYKQKYKNRIVVFRRRAGLTQAHVAHLLGHRGTATVSSYETGRTLPTLMTGFGLGIILRVPVEFLFGSMYDEMRVRIRAEEERMAAQKVGTKKGTSLSTA